MPLELTKVFVRYFCLFEFVINFYIFIDGNQPGDSFEIVEDVLPPLMGIYCVDNNMCVVSNLNDVDIMFLDSQKDIFQSGNESFASGSGNEGEKDYVPFHGFSVESPLRMPCIYCCYGKVF